MIVYLNKNDLINLVKGTTPPLDSINDFKFTKYGQFLGSYDKWQWNLPDSISKKELWKLYKLCRNS